MKKTLSFIKKRWWLVVLLILAALVGFSSIKKGSQQKEIETTKAKRGDLQRIVALSGSVDAHQKADLRFQGSGLLVWVGAKEGDLVKKWQALASLDTRSLKKSFEKEMYDYLAYRSDWEQGREDYQYEEKWFEISDTAKRILEKNQYNLDKAVLDVELADLAVKFATLTTPIEGLVTKVDVPNPGVNVTPATAEFSVVDPGSVYFYAEADEDEVVEIKAGQEVTIYIDAYPEKTYSGKVTRVGFVPTASTGSPKYLVEIDFDQLDNSDYQFRLGMEGEGNILTASKTDVLYIPIDSVNGTDEKWVYVVGPQGEKEKRVVETGFKTDDDVEIVSGLKEGEAVVSY